MSEIEGVSNRSEKINWKLRGLLDRHEYPSDLKTRWLIASLDIVLEDQEAILLLIRSQLIGAAFAMVRVVFDTMMRAIWINACATERQIEQAWNDELDWLRIRVRTEIEQSGFSRSQRRDRFFQSLKEVWPAMCDYTHSGARQISRRFTNGEHKPNYSEAEIIEAISVTNAALLLLGGKFFLSVGQRQEAEETLKLLIECSVDWGEPPADL